MSEIKVRAYIKGVEQAPRKVGVVASLVRGRTVEDALAILGHTPRRSARAVKKAIESARANALHNNNANPKSLVISVISVTIGKRLKRYKPASRNRALPFQKKSSNILVELTGTEKSKPVAKAKTVKKARPTVKTKTAKAVKKEIHPPKISKKEGK